MFSRRKLNLINSGHKSVLITLPGDWLQSMFSLIQHRTALQSRRCNRLHSHWSTLIYQIRTVCKRFHGFPRESTAFNFNCKAIRRRQVQIDKENNKLWLIFNDILFLDLQFKTTPVNTMKRMKNEKKSMTTTLYLSRDVNINHWKCVCVSTLHWLSTCNTSIILKEHFWMILWNYLNRRFEALFLILHLKCKVLFHDQLHVSYFTRWKETIVLSWIQHDLSLVIKTIHIILLPWHPEHHNNGSGPPLK